MPAMRALSERAELALSPRNRSFPTLLDENLQAFCLAPLQRSRKTSSRPTWKRQDIASQEGDRRLHRPRPYRDANHRRVAEYKEAPQDHSLVAQYRTKLQSAGMTIPIASAEIILAGIKRDDTEAETPQHNAPRYRRHARKQAQLTPRERAGCNPAIAEIRIAPRRPA